MSRNLLLAVCVGLGTWLPARSLWAGPPPAEQQVEPPPEQQPLTTTIEGRVREAGGSRAPVGGASVMLVAGDPAAKPGKPARTPLDPEAVTWMLQTETDDEGRFVLEDVPLGTVRVVVVAGGYARLDQWAQAPSPRALELVLDPDQSGTYRTEVATAREQIVEPTHSLDGQQARHYPGGGHDPMLVTLNMPGVARSPGGLGLLSMRGGNPTETGFYLDGHPVPRVFHVVPIAGVLAPPLLDRIDMDPGNYGPGYGSFSAGMVHVHSRAGRRTGIHGQAHVDLFDVGLSSEAPVGPGAVHFAIRRSHIDGVVQGVERVIGNTGILLPTYWDYLARLDMPVRRGHRLTLRALGAGDRLRGRGPDAELDEMPNLFDFSAAFHRFDLDYRIDDGLWRLLVSPSLRLDSTRVGQDALTRRDANVFSGRVELDTKLRPWLTLQFGTDVVYERWRRRERVVDQLGGDLLDPDQLSKDESFSGQQLRAGLWLGSSFKVGHWSIVPSLRMNLFDYAGQPRVRFDPRLEVHGLVHPKLELFAKLGLFSIPVVATTGASNANLFDRNGSFAGGVADVPDYLIAYFDPGIEGEPREGSSSATYAVQAATGVQAQLPWELTLRGTLFWRELLPTKVPVYVNETAQERDTQRRRSYGLELFLKRSLGSFVDGWLGYTLLRARVKSRPDSEWLPAIFDQRHNFVLLLSFALPRNFRFGARFRLVSGNPLEAVLGAELATSPYGSYYRPIRGARGTAYQPLFHQLDLRIDKRWLLRRVGVSAYLDVQNVYDRRYPEIQVYALDWTQSESLIGLPIYPSIGVQVDY